MTKKVLKGTVTRAKNNKTIVVEVTRKFKHPLYEKEIKRSNSTNFWDLNRLPGQTRNYVPKILAFFLISKNPEKYGFNTNNSCMELNY